MLVLNEHQDPEYTEVPWQFMAGPVAVVHRLMICPTLEGRGIARLLMKYAEESAERSGYRIMRLDAFMKNPRALRLYENLDTVTLVRFSSEKLLSMFRESPRRNWLTNIFVTDDTWIHCWFIDFYNLKGVGGDGIAHVKEVQDIYPPLGCPIE